MDSDPRRQRVVLAAVLGLLAVVAWWWMDPFGGPSVVPANRPQARPAPTATRGVSADDILSAGVGLDRLARVPPAPADSGRNPFTLGQSDAPDVPEERSTSGGPAPGLPSPTMSAMPPAPTGPPAPPPITVKFIGMVTRSDVRVAVLSDGRNVYHGREGEIVDGRWRIVRIGEESLQIEYVDGRGRQTVRLSG
jgi:hypothetical protein